MKIALVLVVIAAALGGGVWGYAAWQHHQAEASAAQYQLGVEAAQKALTPFKDTGPTMPNPFPTTGQTKLNP